MILTETQKAWRKMELEELIEEHRIAASNERLWAKGANTPEQVAMHEDNVNEHLTYIAYLKAILDEDEVEYEDEPLDLPVNVTILASQLNLIPTTLLMMKTNLMKQYLIIFLMNMVFAIMDSISRLFAMKMANLLNLLLPILIGTQRSSIKKKTQIILRFFFCIF